MRTSKRAAYRICGILLACLSTFAIEGCGSSPTRVEADVVAASNVNQTEAGQGTPIVVRIYELKTTGSFVGADFFSLFDKEGETLGGDLLAREELELRPEESRKVERTTAPDAQYIGVVGAFRNIDRARWRDTYALKAGKTNRIQVKLAADAVHIH